MACGGSRMCGRRCRFAGIVVSALDLFSPDFDKAARRDHNAAPAKLLTRPFRCLAWRVTQCAGGKFFTGPTDCTAGRKVSHNDRPGCPARVFRPRARRRCPKFGICTVPGEKGCPTVSKMAFDTALPQVYRPCSQKNPPGYPVVSSPLNKIVR
jgi:hypothetical protein